MLKKLNRKLKFALAGFGAFALAGVSCVGLASLENQDAIASYAIDTPSEGNPVYYEYFTFSYVSGAGYSVTIPDIYVVLDGYVFNHQSINYLRWEYNGTSTGQFLNPTFVIEGNQLTLNGGTYYLTGVSASTFFSEIDTYYLQLELVSSQVANLKVKFNNFDYNHYTIHYDGSLRVQVAVVDTPPIPTPVDYVHDIVDILVAGITKLGQGIGQGVSSFVQSLAFNTAGDGLSIYFILVCVFGGIALAVALTSKIFMWLSGLGA